MSAEVGVGPRELSELVDFMRLTAVSI